MKLTKNQLNRMKDSALNNYKTLGINPHTGPELFTMECYIDAILTELKRLGLTDLVYEREDLTMDKSVDED